VIPDYATRPTTRSGAAHAIEPCPRVRRRSLAEEKFRGLRNIRKRAIAETIEDRA